MQAALISLGLAETADEATDDDVALIIASDGVWDLWGFDQVAEELISPDNADPSLMATRCADFCEKTRAKGCHYFDEVCRASGHTRTAHTERRPNLPWFPA